MRVAPFCVEELADYLRRKPFEVRLLINALLREGAIVKLDSSREGGPFYEMPDYVEASKVRVPLVSRRILSILELGLTVETKVKPNSRMDTKDTAYRAQLYLTG